ncbi:MAG: hypothetical protein WA949_03280 [Phormidesmis sp.]
MTEFTADYLTADYLTAGYLTADCLTASYPTSELNPTTRLVVRPTVILNSRLVL